MKNEDKPNFPMDKNDEIQSSSKKRKEHPVDMLANKTKTELLAEAHSSGIKGSSFSQRDSSSQCAPYTALVSSSLSVRAPPNLHRFALV
jgi:hypothetical protein